MILPIFHGLYPLFILMGAGYLLHLAGITFVDDAVEERIMRRQLSDYLKTVE